jgi:hypothetical protein
VPDLAGGTTPVNDYVRAEHSPLSHLAHDWELHSAVLLSPAEERSMVREPAQAVPDTIAQRLGRLRLLLVPYIACTPDGDLVAFTKPAGEAHTSVWAEADGSTGVVLACRELDAHDTGFELLGCVAELLQPRLTEKEVAQFDQLLEEELREGTGGEIDEEALRAKQTLLERRSRRHSREEFEKYRDISLIETVTEYMHGLWHDVQIRVGPDHLPVPQLRLRMDLLARLFPPNEGYQVFDKEIEGTVTSDEQE